MADEADYIRQGFVAERRSLLIVSFILFFYQQAGLQIEKINAFGNEAKISDPWWIAFALWVLWGYFFVRFLQYLQSIPDKGFWTAYERQMEKSITRSAFKGFKRSYVPTEEFRNFEHGFKILKTDFLMNYPEYRSVKLDLTIAHKMGEEVAGQGASHKEDFTSWRLRWAKIKSMAHVIVSTHVATEYFLPILLALLPLVNFLRKFL
jgi:hypothetical protein